MNISSISSESNVNGTTTTAKQPSSLADKDVFLKILSTELSNQDPLNASNDSTQQIAQLAQFSALEQSQTLNESISKMLLTQKITEGASLIGKKVQVCNENGQTYTDNVKSVKIINNAVYIVTESGTESIDSVTEVGE